MSYVLMTGNDGRQFYKVTVSAGNGKGRISRRWYVPQGLKQETILRRVQKFEDDLKRDIAEGKVVSRSERKQQEEESAKQEASVQTFKAYCENVFLPLQELQKSKRTYYEYSRELKNNAYPVIGNYKLPEITTSMLKKLMLNYQKSHSVNSARKLYAIIRCVFEDAFKDDLIVVNPILKLDRPAFSKGEDSDKKCFTEEEMSNILMCLENEPLKWRTLVRVLIDTGCRRGEVVALEWSAIDLESGTVTISTTYNILPSTGRYFDKPKTGHSRVVYISPECTALLKQWKIEQSKKCISHYVFARNGGTEPMNSTSIYDYFKRFERRYGIEDFHPHKLRHSFASIAIAHGVDVASVARILGHGNTNMTFTWYVHSNDETARKGAQAVHAAFASGSEDKTKTAK